MVLVIVVVLVVINIAMIGGVAASGQDAHIASLRVETVRAFYAAESGATVVAKGLAGGPAPPAAGSTLAMGSQSIHFVEVPITSGQVVVEGRCGFARRRLWIEVE